MKSIVFLIVIGLYFSAAGDTISFWHVHYNGIRIAKFNQNIFGEIRLKIDTIEAGDSITVRYFRDTPCHTCASNLWVRDNAGSMLVRSIGKGTFTPLTFSLEEIRRRRPAFVDVFYFEGDPPDSLDGYFLFRIKLE